MKRVPLTLLRFAAAMLACGALLTHALAGAASAQTVLDLRITQAGQAKQYIALASPMAANGGGAPALGQPLDNTLRENLAVLPFLGVTSENAVLGGSRLQGVERDQIDFRRFQLAGADYVLTAGWTSDSSVELRVYTAYGSNLVVGKAYSQVTQETVPTVADRFCAALLEVLTGSGDFFRSTLAFVRASGPGTNRNVFTVRPTGRNLRRITDVEGACLSPAWSKDASAIVFSIVAERYHYLGLWRGGSITRERYKGNTVIAPEFTPQGRIAVSLTTKENPDIYLLNASLQPERPLVQGDSINVSPSFDASGRLMAYVSSRFGNPHIFVRDLASGQDMRITTTGYNTDPSISPDGSMVAFTRMTGGGHRIFIHDRKTSQERQITFGPGSDEQPAFAPDNYFVAFSSTRSGGRQVFMTTRNGDEPVPVPTGGPAGFPAWGLTDAP